MGEPVTLFDSHWFEWQPGRPCSQSRCGLVQDELCPPKHQVAVTWNQINHISEKKAESLPVWSSVWGGMCTLGNRNTQFLIGNKSLSYLLNLHTCYFSRITEIPGFSLQHNIASGLTARIRNIYLQCRAYSFCPTFCS